MSTETTPKRAAVYIRVSSPQQKEGYSLEVQEAACRQYAADKGYQVVALFQEVHTAEDFYERPTMTKLREAARRGEFDVMVGFNLDRVTRNQAHIFILDDELNRHSASLEFATEEFANTAVGKFIRNAKAFAAEVELEKIKSRSWSGKIARVKNGGLMPGPVLFGYQWADEKKTKYREDPITAVTVRKIFSCYSTGKSLRELARDLTEEGIATPRGKKWDFVSVRRLLRDRQYIGEATALREKTWKENGKKRRVKLPPEEWVHLPEGTVPAIVDRAMFDLVQDRLATNKERSVRNNRTPEAFLLRGGFVRCGYCGGPMAVQRSTKRVAYQCSKAHRTHPTCSGHSIATQTLDDATWSKVEAILTDATVIERELARMVDADPTADDLDSIERALRDISRQQANLTRALAKIEERDADPVFAELAQLAKRKRQLETERMSVLGRRETWRQAQENLRSVQEWVSTVSERLGEATYDLKRLAMDALGLRVHVYRSDHDPRYTITASIPLCEDTSRSSSGT